MNKKSFSILFLTAIYSIFFYEQHVGINFLIFTLAALGLFFFQDKTAFKSKPVLALSVAAIFTATTCAIHGSNLSMWATIVSLALIPGVFLNKRSAIFIDFCTTIVTMVISLGYMIVDIIESHKNGKGKGFLRLLKYIVPSVFVIIFFFIYRAMNPLFENFTQEIAEFISVGWFFFTLGGFFIVYSIYKQRRATAIDDWEKNWLLKINPEALKASKWNEGLAFVALFVILNAMLVTVNSMDVNYLYMGAGMPDGITHKEFVHKGVGMLILSIILGISILLFFFRGQLNYGKNKSLSKGLAVLWVVQNTFMVVSTSIRNSMYVDESLLTYKRIGVYFWLFFALIGLITLFVKLWQNKTVWYLARKNFAALFIVLVASAGLDWDMVVSDYNINRAKEKDEIAGVDKNYMLSLSEGNIAGLFSIKDLEGFEVDSVYSYSYSYDRYWSNSTWLDAKVYDFLADDAYGDWRSFSTRRTRVRNDIQQLHTDGKIDKLDLQNHYVRSVVPLYQLPHLKELNLNNNGFSFKSKLAGLNGLKELKKLSLNENYIENLDTLSTNNNLNNLEVAGNQIKNLQFLKSFPNVDTVDIARNQLQTLASLPALKNLRQLTLDGNPLNDIEKLQKLPKLVELNLSDIAVKIGKFPKMDQLNSLSLRNSKYVVWYSFKQSSGLKELQTLDASSNELTSLDFLLHNKTGESKYPALTTLRINYNSLSSLYNIGKFEQLSLLDASSNQIYNAYGIEKLVHLKELYLANNKLSSLDFVTSLTQLNRLDVANNDQIKSAKPLALLTNLNHLNLSYTSIKSINNINAFNQLVNLNLSGCRIVDWSKLKAFKVMKVLSASYVKKEDLKHFKQVKTLKKLYLSNTEDEVIELFKKEMPNVEIY